MSDRQTAGRPDGQRGKRSFADLIAHVSPCGRAVTYDVYYDVNIRPACQAD